MLFYTYRTKALAPVKPNPLGPWMGRAWFFWQSALPGVPNPCNDFVILNEVKDLGRKREQGTFVSMAQLLHFVQHDRQAVLPENLGSPRECGEVQNLIASG